VRGFAARAIDDVGRMALMAAWATFHDSVADIAYMSDGGR
jgi:hypothetical protein